MPVLAHLHQLFHADTCHPSIPTRRWNERPLRCPRCQSDDGRPWGMYHDRPGLNRSWCHGWRRPFNDLTHTLLAQSQRSLSHWMLATFLWCLACSSRRIAREWGGHSRTSSRWCWWLRKAALFDELHRQFEGTGEADDLYHTAGQKGHAKPGGKQSLGRRPRPRRQQREPGRGHSHQDRPAISAWVSRPGPIVGHAVKDFTVKTVQQAADVAVQAGSRLYTDSAGSDRALTGYVQAFVNPTQQDDARGEVPENRAEGLFSWLKPYLRGCRGMRNINLPGYVGFFQCLRNMRQRHAFEQAELILCAAFDPSLASRARQGEFVTCVDHFDRLQTAIN